MFPAGEKKDTVHVYEGTFNKHLNNEAVSSNHREMAQRMIKEIAALTLIKKFLKSKKFRSVTYANTINDGKIGK